MKKDIDKEVEICDCCEVHENLSKVALRTQTIQIVNRAEVFIRSVRRKTRLVAVWR